MDRRFSAEHADLARAVGFWVLRLARDRFMGTWQPIPNTRAARAELKAAIWSQVLKPFYIGAGDDAFAGAVPRSPFARLLYDGIAGVTRIAAERQVALVRSIVRDAEVMRWLTAPRRMPVVTEVRLRDPRMASLRNAQGRIDVERARAALVSPAGMYEPYHLWVDPNGYRLSDRVWNTSIHTRSRIDALLEYEISRGTSAVEMAELVERYLTPGARLGRTSTPYGTEGSYAARRLARTEITANAGRATVNSSAANPFVQAIQWVLSPSHPKVDICDDYARGGPNGDGVYPIAQLPQYPPHPFCLCHLRPVPSGDVASLIQQLRAEIRAASPIAQVVHGMFSPEFLARALLDGSLADVVRGADPSGVGTSVFSAARRAGVV
jgi:hypothetical protein